MVAQSPHPARRKNKQRRRGRSHNKAASPGSPSPALPSAVLAEGGRPPESGKGVDEPLTRREIAEMRQHFRLLRQYRKALRLKVNAAEDLLLNEAREPTHRGVCQHLLAKVDRASVIAAAERLDPAAAVGLLSGVLRFAPELEYVLLFLENVRRTASQDQAVAALSQGLERIDFFQVSSGQMRRVLDLIVELFDSGQRPHLLLSLLRSKSFRQAFDNAVASLPEPLAGLVVPMRAVQLAMWEGRPNPYGTSALRDGIRLLLTANHQSLLEYPPQVRRQLFELGLQSCEAPKHVAHAGLKALLSGFPKADRNRGELGMRLARHLLASGNDRDARALLNMLANDYPEFRQPRRWLEALDAPRIGRVAVPDGPRGTNPTEAAAGKRAGIWLESMRPVWVYVYKKEEAQAHADSLNLLNTIAIPSVAPLLHCGEAEDGSRYVVVSHPGQNLERVLTRKGGIYLDQALQVCSEAVTIFGAMASCGSALPDARLSRFELDNADRLWLVDLRGAEHKPQDAVWAHQLDLARRFCRSVLGQARRYLPPESLFQRIESSTDCAQLARTLRAFDG